MAGTEISGDLREAIEAVVRGELGRFGVERVDVAAVEDTSGDPALLVSVHYGAPDAEPDPQVAAGTITKLNDRLFALKERRFAHIAHRVPERAPRLRAAGHAGR
ncbi:hypothetical protein ACLBXP_21690 [Methylobacterium sp. A54F]